MFFRLIWAVSVQNWSLWAEIDSRHTRAKIRIDPRPSGVDFKPPVARFIYFDMFFWTLGRTWADFGPTLGRPWADFWSTLGRLWADLGPTLGQLWTNFGPTLDQPWANLGLTFGILWTNFGPTFGKLLANV